MSEKTMEAFGVYGLTIMDQQTFKPKKEMKVIGDIMLPIDGEIVPLRGGGYTFPVDAEPGQANLDATATLREFPTELFTYLGGADITTNTAEASGAVVTAVNRKGTSAISATTGIATVGLKSGATANLKAGLYVGEVMSATTVDIYAASNVDLRRGTTAITTSSNDNKITASALTITTGAAVEVPNLGVELTGGSGTIGMTVGDTFYFEVRPANGGSDEITVGKQTSQMLAFAGFFTARKKSTGEIVYILAPKVKGIGVPFGFKENGWAEGSIKFTLCIDDILGYAYKLTNIKPAQ